MKHLLIDTNNLFYRTRYITKSGDINERIGLCYHVFFNSLLNSIKKFEIDYAIFFVDSKSWRKFYYKKYKENRKTKELMKTPKDKEEDFLFLRAYDDLIDFLQNKTNSTVIKIDFFETDDLISFWIEIFKNDFHVILSTDKDYIQLLSHNVILYNGIDDKIFSTLPFVDKNKSKIEIIEDPKWELFKKIIRGDSSDNIFSVYPGIRENKLKIIYNDMEKKGYDWNNFILNKIQDIDGNETLVQDLYERNKTLIDLKNQPKELKEEGIKSILEILNNKKNINGVGINFLKFTKKHKLERLSKNPDEFCKILNKMFKYRIEKNETNNKKNP